MKEEEEQQHSEENNWCSNATDSSLDRHHDWYLQKDGAQYFRPIIFQDAMDIRECELYYSIVDAQQAGGVLLQRTYGHAARCQAANTRDIAITGCVSKSTPTSILRKKRWTTPTASKIRPSLSRSISFSDHLFGKDTTVIDIPFDPSRSMRQLVTPRVSFRENVHVVTIHPISDIPHDIRIHLWMSRDELMISMHDAAIEQMEEQIATAKREEAEPAVRKSPSQSSLERSHSSTSVVAEYEDCHVSECM
jgi:hypothetical protein